MTHFKLTLFFVIADPEKNNNTENDKISIRIEKNSRMLDSNN